MVKNPTVKLVDKFGKDLDECDIEYTGWLDREARDEISISTTVGTAGDPLPTARGLLLYTDSLQQVYTIARAGTEDCAEKLLIGTLYSHYATRHTKLAGEAAIADGTLPVLTEVNQAADTRFMIAGEIIDCIADTSDVTLVEVLPDNYEGLEYEETV